MHCVLHQQTSPTIDPLESIATAQTILDRVLFIAFAEDTGLLPKNILEQAFESEDKFNPRPVWDNFKGLFSAIDSGSDGLGVPKYNGGLFAADGTIDALALSNDVCERFKKIGDYDFASEISVTVLGHIFEQSIADVERLQAIARREEGEEEKAKGTSGRRKRDGVVYTPDYIARFIVEQTVGTHIREIFDIIIEDYTQKKSDNSDYKNILWKNKKTSERKAWLVYRDRLTTLRIVDPACGSGVFLVMAFDYLKGELNRVNDKIAELEGTQGVGLFDPDSEILTNNLFGVDVNSESVEIAKLSLWIKTARRGKVLDSLDDNIMVGDSLIEDSNYAYLDHAFTWQTAFPDIFAEGGFDIVLGNPPYVRQELLLPLKPYLEKRFDVYHGVADLFCYFFERGLRILKPNGRMGYICNATYFKTNSGKPLRRHLLAEATLENIVDFGDIQVFEGVTTYPAIITMRRGKADDQHQLSYWNVDALPDANFRAAYRKNGQDFPQSALTDGPWELENHALRNLRGKIKADKPKLEDVYLSPYRGILTGRNSAFVVDRTTRDQLILDDPNSDEIIVPFLEGKDLKPWRSESRDQWLIFTRRGVDIDAYPAIKTHLEALREMLEPKPEDWKPSGPDDKWAGRKKGSYQWYEIQDSVDYHEAFTAPKITYGHFSERPLFSFDTNGLYSNDKSYIIQSDDRFLLALLHSSVFWFLITGDAPIVRGKFYEMRTYYINPLPIPSATDSQKTALATLAETSQAHAEARYALQEALRHRIPDLRPSDSNAKLNTKLKEWWLLPDFAAFRAEIKKCLKAEIPLNERTDWEDWITRDKAEIHRLSGEITKLEAEINKQVYALFDLTDDEITLLEANI